MSVMQLSTARDVLRSENSRQWAKALMLTAAFFVLYALLASHAFASDGTEFADSATKFETWVKGNLGKLAAFVALAIGSVLAAVKKDWSWFFGAMVLSIGVGILAGIVNASFTATI